MDEYLDRDFIENYENADIILTLLFAFVDIIIILFSIFNLSSKNQKIYFLKYKLFSLFIIDILLRILYVKKYYKEKSFFKECLFSSLMSAQFFLILSFLEQAYYDTRIIKKGKIYKKLNIKFICISFSIITFPYDKFASSQKGICFFQSIIIIYSIFVLYSRLKNKIIKIVQNIINQTKLQDKNIFFCVLGSPLPCLIFFITYYVLRILFLFLENPDFIIYANIILKIIKDSSKYFLFFILEIILFIISDNKMKKEKLSFDFEEKNETSNKL